VFYLLTGTHNGVDQAEHESLSGTIVFVSHEPPPERPALPPAASTPAPPARFRPRSKVTRIGSQRASVFGGARVYLDAPDGGPDWGLRMGLTLIYPK